MFGILDSLARRVLRKGLRRGLLEGNTPWLVASAAALVFHLLFRPEKDKVIRHRLKVGETIIVEHKPAPSRSASRKHSSAGEDAARA